jgi:hypothetical protein
MQREQAGDVNDFGIHRTSGQSAAPCVHACKAHTGLQRMHVRKDAVHRAHAHAAAAKPSMISGVLYKTPYSKTILYAAHMQQQQQRPA